MQCYRTGIVEHRRFLVGGPAGFQLDPQLPDALPFTDAIAGREASGADCQAQQKHPINSQAL